MAETAKPLLLEVPEVLETARLRLVATRAGMGAMVNAAVSESQEALAPWMPWATAPQTLEAAELHCREEQAKWYSRTTLDFCFLRRDDGAFVGKGGLHTIEWSVPRFEIGYWVRRSCTGRGYATEATGALTALAGTLGARRVEIGCDADNVASRRVAEKSGFTLEGIRRQARRNTAGRLCDACIYARTF